MWSPHKRHPVKSAQPPNSNTTSDKYGLHLLYIVQPLSLSLHHLSTRKSRSDWSSYTRHNPEAAGRGKKSWNRLTSPVTKQLFCSSRSGEVGRGD